MPNRTCKNYSTDGGDKWVVGGVLAIEEGAEVEGITTATIVDALTSTEATKALSAKQGKILNDKVDALVVDALDSTDATKALSAKQGKALNEAVAALQGDVDLMVAENQEESTATEVVGLVADFNALVGKLVAAGLMEAPEEGEEA